MYVKFLAIISFDLSVLRVIFCVESTIIIEKCLTLKS